MPIVQEMFNARRQRKVEHVLGACRIIMEFWADMGGTKMTGNSNGDGGYMSIVD